MLKRSSFSVPCLRLILLCSLVAVWACAIFIVKPTAQARRRGNANAKRGADSKRRSREEANKAARLREQALATLAASADEARTLDDRDERAHVLTIVADALWLADKERARAVFRDAWEAATAADKAAQEAEGAAELDAPAEGGTAAEARSEVLAKAASRDRELAETFLSALLAAEKEDNAATETRRPTTPQRFDSWRALSAGGRRRLALAYDLLNKLEGERAAEIAAPLIAEGVSADLVTFLLRLREADARAADKIYLSLLERTRANITRADENDALLLASYIFSPKFLVTVDASGAAQFRVVTYSRAMMQSANDSPSIAARTRIVFFETTATILLRPPQVSEDSAQETSAVARSFFAVERLLPYFEREAAQYAVALQSQRESLANRMDANRRQQLSGQAARERVTSANASDPLSSGANELARARTESERDRLRLKLVKTAARRKLWSDAKRFAAEIADAGRRRAANVFVLANQIATISDAFAENTTDDYERAAAFVKKSDVSPFLRAWGLAQAASMAKRRNRHTRARELLDEAGGYAAQAEVNAGQRAAAFAMLTKVASVIADERAWEWLAEAVQAANSAEDFDSEQTSFSILPTDAAMTTTGEDETTENDFRISSDEFRLGGAFTSMSKLDAGRAFLTARRLENRAARLLVATTVARSVLEQR